MMKNALLISLLLFSSVALYSKEAIHSVSPTTYYNMQTTEAQTPRKLRDVDEKQVAGGAMSQRMGSSEVMMIHPETRAKDLKEAFDYLKKMSPTTKLGVKLINQEVIAEILDMTLMTGGTVIIFRTNSVQGQKFQVVKTEEIDTITDG